MSRRTGPHRALLGWLLYAHWRERPAGVLAGALSVAIGVALALGVHWVNQSALAQFAAALALVNGDAQAQVIGRTGEFDDRLFARIAAAPFIATASPVLELRAVGWREAAAGGRFPVGESGRPMFPMGESGRPIRGESLNAGSASSGEPAPAGADPADAPGPGRVALRLLGIDPLRASQVTPALLPTLAQNQGDDPSALFADDAVFLSRSAARQLGVAPGDVVTLQAGEHRVRMRVAGSVDGVADGQAIAVLDLGNAQQHFGLIGRLSRIDLRFDARADARAVQAALEPLLPPQVFWSATRAAGQRMSNLSRAYRVNLNVLALVALFTGAFIVQATLALRVARAQREIALLCTLGAPRGFAASRVLADALAIGMIGALAGVAGGIALASALLLFTGGDLGGGYFESGAVRVSVDAASVGIALTGGVAVALAGALAPMRAARAIAPARALRAGTTENVLAQRRTARWALALMALALPLLAVPPIADLPLAAYAAIAVLLLAGVMLTGALIGPAATALSCWLERRRPATTLWLATLRIAGAPGSASSALGGVVASFALASAMAIMVTSFRVSVSDWLDQVLPADLYAALEPSAAGAGLGEPVQALIASLPGVRQVEFTRRVPLLLDEHRPAVMLVARPLRAAGPTARLPLTGRPLEVPVGEIGVWVSEAFADIHTVRPGQRLTLPLGSSDVPVQTFVAGIWRDYARQHGAIAIDIDAYRSLTGDRGANEVAWWLFERDGTADLIERARALSAATEAMEYRDTAQLKSLSLRIFDRSFAITHALEAIAIAVALFGVTTAVAGEALARLREFGVLRHLGLTRVQVGRQFSIEAALGAGIACLWGLALGAAVAWILVHRVNPHSFHWTMSMHWPLGVLATSGVAMIALAALAARLAAREATGKAPVLAVKEDW